MDRCERERLETIESGSPLWKDPANNEAYEKAKVDRVLSLVQAVKEGRYDGFCVVGFASQ